MTGRCLRAAALATCLAVPAAYLVAPAAAADKAMIVMDASGSMWGQIEGRTKIEIARETLASVLGSAPESLELGLIAYGHREKGACGDIEEMVPAGPGTRAAIAAAVDGLNPRGKTPLSASVAQAAEALRYTEDKATVILITDGIETCEADPCAAAAALEAAGVDFTAHVVGFGLTDEEGRAVACIAQNTGGTFIMAENAGELAEALTETVAAAPAPAPDPAPEPAAPVGENVAITAILAEGASGDDINGAYEFVPMDGDTPSVEVVASGYDTQIVETLEPGRYHLAYRKDLVRAETVVEVPEQGRVARELVLDAAVLDIAVRPAEGAEPSGNGAYEVTAGGATSGGYTTGTLVVPAGPVSLSARLGNGSAAEEITVAPGEKRTVDLVVGVGVLNVSAVYAEGGPVVGDGSLFTEVFPAETGLDGTREAITGDYGTESRFELPPGNYLVRARLGQATGEASVRVATGEASDVVVDIDAGVLAVAAPGAYWIEILEAKKNIEGNGASVSGQYGEELQVTLPPGDYLVVRAGEGGADRRERAVTIAPAERAEIIVE